MRARRGLGTGRTAARATAPTPGQEATAEVAATEVAATEVAATEVAEAVVAAAEGLDEPTTALASIGHHGPMEPERIAALSALGRIAIGTTALAAPGLVGRLWLGAGGSGPEAKLLMRALGARDLALGIGLRAALKHGAPVRGWLEGGALADAVDCGATLAARGSLPPVGRLLVAGIAGSAVVTGTWLARTLGTGAPSPHP